ncbi:efflux RND transporter permease subunit [Bradyrhizobium sp. HKCCYLS2038]|uniref:efflux RND transporter permease subunit n=1 Tax=unclassified Bradyrhizobium TaxID=2631580 RepID=UPI003EB97C65
MASISQAILLVIEIGVGCPGVDADAMHKAFTLPLEQRLSDIRGVAQMSSATSLGESHIGLEFVAGDDIERARQDVKAATDVVLSGLAGSLSCDSARIALVEKGQR